MEFNSLTEIFDFAIEEEQKAFDFYMMLVSMAKSDDMKSVFTDFAKEEIKHKAKLIEIKQGAITMNEKSDVQSLKLDNFIVTPEPTANMDYEAALKIAISKEENAYNLYMSISKVAPAQYADVFEQLASEEIKHKLRFEVEYDDNVLRFN